MSVKKEKRIKPEIRSILDSDLYSFTQQAAILKLYSDMFVEYEFNNRRLANTFSPQAVTWIKKQIKLMSKLKADKKEIQFLRKRCSFLPEWYFAVIKDYRFDPSEVTVNRTPEGHLKVAIKGLWWRTVLWEVPLMAIISCAYFLFEDTKWDERGQEEKMVRKANKLYSNHCKVSDFSTRRRRNFKAQDRVVRILRKYENFAGTSNAYLAMKYDVRPIGTMSHQWIMAHQVIAGVRRCNLAAMTAWQTVYNGRLGIALPDTVGSAAFFEDLSFAQPYDLARLFDGVRHDSGDWKKFTDETILFYKGQGIDPLTKTIIFSDGLNVDLACEICQYCEGKINCAFGIGTFFSNDYEGSPALNMVIKLMRVFWLKRWVPVVKISDSPSKSIGERDAQRVAFWACKGVPLDDPMWSREILTEPPNRLRQVECSVKITDDLNPE